MLSDLIEKIKNNPTIEDYEKIVISLQNVLQYFIDTENYEKASEVRDMIKEANDIINLMKKKVEFEKELERAQTK